SSSETSEGYGLRALVMPSHMNQAGREVHNTLYSGVSFVRLSNAQEVVEFSILWRTTTENPAMRALLQLCADGTPGFAL
ncbi:type 2 periplasmic-binding domain-containing protein, partial [Endobacter medicaginis]